MDDQTPAEPQDTERTEAASEPQESSEILASEETQEPVVDAAPEPTEPAAEAEEPVADAAPEPTDPAAEPLDAPSAAEPEAAPAPQAPEGFGAILAQFEQSTATEKKNDPQVGGKVSGTVISIGEDTTLVDIGTKSEAVIPTADLRDKEGNVTVEIGAKLEATVAGRDPETNALLLKRKISKNAAQAEAAGEIRRAFETQMTLEGRITGLNKGGLEVDVAGVRCFCPISQIENRFVEDASPYVGQTLTFRVLRFEEPTGSNRRPNIVLSRRSLLQEEADVRTTEVRATLSIGTVITGHVTSLTTYGAFVDLGGVEGLLHVSEIGHSRLAKPEDALAVGQEVEVQIIRIERAADDKRGERISLSRKALERDPWRDAPGRFPERSIVHGKVVRLETFGAFVELEPGLDGLLHISEIGNSSGRRLQHAREALSVGQELSVRVLGVDTARHRISLGLGDGSEDHHDDDLPEPPRAAPAGTFGSLGDFFKGRR